jgi:hypothetical protein
MVGVREIDHATHGARLLLTNHFRKVARGVGRFVIWPWHPQMIQAKPTIIELEMDKLEEILRRLDAKELDADDYETIKAVIGAYVCLFNVVGDKDTTIRRLRQMLFGAKTEKTSAVIGGLKDVESVPVPAEAKDAPESSAATEPEARAKVDAEAPAETHAANDSPGEGAGAGSHGDLHLGDRGDGRRAEDRVVPQRTPARRGEPEGRAAPACCGTASADSNVRCAFAEPAWRAEDDRSQLLGPRPAAVRR